MVAIHHRSHDILFSDKINYYDTPCLYHNRTPHQPMYIPHQIHCWTTISQDYLLEPPQYPTKHSPLSQTIMVHSTGDHQEEPFNHNTFPLLMLTILTPLYHPEHIPLLLSMLLSMPAIHITHTSLTLYIFKKGWRVIYVCS